jgi:small subunit ribosomal protein S1
MDPRSPPRRRPRRPAEEEEDKKPEMPDIGARPLPPQRGALPGQPSVSARPERDPNTPKLDQDDLMAIAQMDPAELAALMEGTVRRPRLEPGTKVAGTVTRVGRDTIFVDVGGKSEGQIDRIEFPDVVVGAELQAFVVDNVEQGLSLSKTLSGQAAAEHLEEARASKMPVDGKVTSRNTGGFEVRIGTVRAFCPASLISRIPEVDLDAFVGQTLQFRVIETGEKVVVNRRVLQEEEAFEKAQTMWTTLAIGQQHRGIVRSVQPFGFFVDIGGVDGLVPKREISWKGVDDPRTVVRVGQAVEVVILDITIEGDSRKLTLSAKALEEDPWTAVDLSFHEGGIYPGTVVRAETFGLFVELAPGLSGLVHTSKLAAGSPSVGDAIHVRLLSIDRERRRLELAPAQEGETSAEAPAGERRLRGTVSEVLKNGVVVQLDDGRTGWLPESEVDLPSGTVLAQRFRRGKAIEARLVRDDPRRPQLSMRDAMDAEERNWRSHQSQQKTQSRAPSSQGGQGFGTLGDLLGGLKLPKK